MDKLQILLKQNKKLFHTNDLRLLWNIKNPATLRKTISRYIQKGVLIPVYRGFYSVIALKEIKPLELGSSAIHNYCYVSTETVLVQNGIIFQNLSAYTFCSSKTKTIQIGDKIYKSRQLADIYLYNKIGIIDMENYRIATVERAMADMLYFNPHYYFDQEKSIDKEKFEKIKMEVYPARDGANRL